jgi:hypothetical protein
MMVAGVAAAIDVEQYSDVPPGTMGNAPAEPGAPQTTTERALTFYNDRATWLADPLLTGATIASENFAGTSVPPNSVIACDPPFNSSTNNACFAPGAIIPGISVELLVVDPGSSLLNVVLTPPFLGIDCTAVGPNTFGDDGAIDFNPPARAVGLDVLAPFGPITFTVNIFDPAGAPLGSTTTTGNPTTAGSFFGVVSDDITGIGRIQFNDPAGGGELFCNVDWFTPPVPVELQTFTVE